MKTTAIVRLVIAAAAVVAAGSAAAQSLRFVTEESYPFQYMDNKTLKGMAVDVVSEMAKRAGIAAEYELMSWKDAYERAQRDRSTCVYSTARLENRERLFHWVGPIVENRWAAFAKQGAKQKPKALADLRYVRVGVLDGDAKATYLMDNGIAAALNRVSDDALNPPKLTADKNEPGKIDVWVTGYYSAKAVAAKTATSDIEHLFTFETSPNYLACNFGVKKEQLDKLSAALASMKKDGTWEKIVAPYDPALKK
jgi:polar amino acid transport system substrate-binding protein